MAQKRRKKQPFEVSGQSPEPVVIRQNVRESYSISGGPFFDFFRGRGVRETVESIVVAVVLAMLFRTFGAEAYIIPTGSMAPNLQGQHMDVICDHCGYRYLTGSSEDNTTIPVQSRRKVIKTFCPFCRSALVMKPNIDADHNSNEGDRIIVNKFIYDFQQPERFDVIVFKNPNNGKQNFIKRLIGLPNEQLTIENGDIFSLDQSADGEWQRQIVRKPMDKLRTMLHLVDDTNFIAPELTEFGWPSRWQEWGNGESQAWTLANQDGKPRFSLENSTSEPAWLRYRHIPPNPTVWERIENEEKLGDVEPSFFQGELISDYYCYNQRVVRMDQSGQIERLNPGLHWVGDLAVSATCHVTSTAGTLVLELVEGGVRFQASIDVESGRATLKNSASYPFLDNEGNPVPTAEADTPVRGSGRFDVMFVNADDQLTLWINDRLIKFNGSCYQPQRYVNPQWSPEDPGDVEPAGITIQNGRVEIDRLKVFRDTYYTSVIGSGQDPENETLMPPPMIRGIMTDPTQWTSEAGLQWLNARFREGAAMFMLEDNQFLPMGDNSPESSDGRIWDGPNFVSGQLMIGRALFIYWPHAKNKPIPYFPNFERMGPIR